MFVQSGVCGGISLTWVAEDSDRQLIGRERREWNKTHHWGEPKWVSSFCCKKIITLFSLRVCYMFIQRGFHSKSAVVFCHWTSAASTAPPWLEMWQCPLVFRVGSELLKMSHMVKNINMSFSLTFCFKWSVLNVYRWAASTHSVVLFPFSMVRYLN